MSQASPDPASTDPTSAGQTAAAAETAAAAAAAVASLPAMTPRRLRVLEQWAREQAPCGEAPWRLLWEMVAGRPAARRQLASVAVQVDPGSDAHALGEAWSSALIECAPARVAEECDRHGVDIAMPGDASYPLPLVDDPEAPAVLFVRGRLSRRLGAMSGPAVAIVGTRSATNYGRDVAAWLGVELSRAGAAIVSGLAVGIDAASHEGALAGIGRSGRRLP